MHNKPGRVKSLYYEWAVLTCPWRRTLLTVWTPGFANTATAKLLAELNRKRMHALLSSTNKPVARSFLFSNYRIISCNGSGREDGTVYTKSKTKQYYDLPQAVITTENSYFASNIPEF